MTTRQKQTLSTLNWICLWIWWRIRGCQLPCRPTSLIDTIRLRMYEMGLDQQKVAALLGISAPRMSENMNGKTEPSLALARTMCQKLNIDPSVALGVVSVRP